MDVEEVETLLQKPDHTEEEYAKIHGQYSFTYAPTAGFSIASEISDLIDLRVPPGSVDAEPPLSALIHAAQGILHPTLSFNHIPDLLDILSQVERAREFSREHAKWALIWQRFYETRPNPNIRVLQKSDKDVLKRLLNPERLDAMRRIFICIVEQVIRMVRSLVSYSIPILTCDSMSFLCGRTLKSPFVYTTTFEFTFLGHLGTPIIKDYIMHR
jgi:hypothetical protein